MNVDVKTRTVEERDALRGAMWEEKFRGELEDHPSPDKLWLTARRYLGKPPFPFSPPEAWPPKSGFGTFGWKYTTAPVEAALAHPVGMIDTAEGYGFGKVEKALGVVIKNGRLGDTWIASKVSRNHVSASATVSAGKRSRDALQVDAIDLYQIHWPVMNRLEEQLTGMAALLREGVIRRVGVCNFCAGQLREAQTIAAKLGFRVVSNQIRLSRVSQGNNEWLVDYCRRSGVRVIAYSALGQGKETVPGEGLRWVASRADTVLFSSNKPDHVRANLAAM